MRNKILPLLAVALGFAMNGFTQSNTGPLSIGNLHLQQVRSDVGAILNAQQSTANKGSIVMERIAGTAVRDNLDRLIDSLRYVYNSGTRGSTLLSNDFSTYLPYGYNPASSELTPGVWDNSMLASLFDTCYIYVYDTLGIQTQWQRYRTAYNASNQPTGYYLTAYDMSSAIIGQERSTMTYTGGGDLSTVKFEFDSSAGYTGIFVTSKRLNLTWAASKRTKDSASTGLGVLAPNTKVMYAYNLSGLLASKTVQIWNTITSSWDNSTYHTYAYDGSQRLKTGLNQAWNTITSSYDNSSLDSFGYSGTATIPVYVSSLHWNMIAMAYEPNSKSEYTMSAGGNSYSDITYYNGDGGGGWAPASKYLVTNTAMDHISTIRLYGYNSGTSDFTDYQGEYRWYYETHDPAAVNNVSAFDKGYSLYPVPAKNTLTINHISGNVSVDIFNMNGQLLMQQAQFASGSVAIDIASLPAGTYFASIKEGNSGTQIKFIK